MKIKQIFYGMVKAGKLTIENRQGFMNHIAQFNGQRVAFHLTQYRKNRSVQQNAYYHGVIVAMIAEDTGNDYEDVHAFLRDKFLPRKLVTIANEEASVATSTTQLLTDEFEVFTEKCRAFAATELHISIPLPHEAL